jgi:endo-1,4-beta-xylanase
MVSFKALLTTALAILPSVIAAPAESTALVARQGSAWQWWTEGQGQFSCQQQGGGKYSCNWNGKSGGGMVAGTGWGAGRKYVSPLYFSLPSILWSPSYSRVSSLF